ncbi:hypothetical protein [Paenibacillus albilobatus]|uniref:hypothetical protein n=1 Tax=Paenibacillus albilobatus TaxID=2716884 RepID=UPI001FD245B2|nr:hypothetical protein [Paenibacillus albilobatus]
MALPLALFVYGSRHPVLPDLPLCSHDGPRRRFSGLQPKGIAGSPWVGLDNFRTVFSSPDFPVLMKNTLLLSVYRIVFNLLPDLVLR